MKGTWRKFESSKAQGLRTSQTQNRIAKRKRRDTSQSERKSKSGKRRRNEGEMCTRRWMDGRTDGWCDDGAQNAIKKISRTKYPL